MFNQNLTMNNSKDIVANSIKLVSDNEMTDINDIFQSKLNSYYPKLNIDVKFNNYYTKIQTDEFLNLRYTKTETDNKFTNYYDKLYINSTFDNYYTKLQIDNSRYTKTEVDDKLNTKVSVSEFTTANQQRITVDAALEQTIFDNKTELTNLINLKRNITDSYNKIEIEDKLNLKLNLSEFTEANQQRITVDGRLEQSILDNRTELTNLINLKRSITDSYNKTEIEDKLNLKLNLSEINNYYNKTYINDTFDTKIQLNDKLNTKQNTIIDNALSISHINNLQNSLNAKQNTITDNSLSISHINLLQSSLNEKQNTITDNSLSISHINNLQNSLDSKQQLLSDLEGNGISPLFGNKLRKIFGSDGIDVTQFLNLGNENDPSNFQIRISGSAINTQLNSKLNSSEIQNYYTKLDTNNLLNAKQNSIGINGLEISNINNLQSSLDSKLSSSSFSNYFTKTELNDKILNYIYQYNNGLYNALYVKHNYGINFAISSNQNPLSSEILLSIETSSGVTINTSAHVENNLTIGGNLVIGTTNILNAITDLQNNPSSSNVDLTNYFTKTEINNKISNYIYQHVDEFFSMLYLKHSFGIEFYVNNIAIMSLLNNSVSITKNTTIDGSLTVNSINILTEINNIKSNHYTKSEIQTREGNYVLNNVNNSMTSNIVTTGNVQAVNLTATGQLSSTGTLGVSGACSLNNTLTVSNITNLNNNVNIAGTATLNGAVNINNACNISKGRGTYGNGGSLRLTTLNNNSDPCALAFVLNGVETHIFEFSWLGLAHFMKLSNTTTVWTQTMSIDRHTGQWKFFKGMLIEGVCTASSFVTSSDSRLKTNIEDVPIEDSINLLKNVSAKTYKRINDNNNKREIGFIAQDFENISISLGENFVDKFNGKLSADGDDIELKTMAYDRVPAILWTVCKNLLARIEVLESKINSN